MAPELLEIGGSLSDTIDRIRREFEKQFPMTSGMDGEDRFTWVNDVFDSHIVVRTGDKHFRVKYTISGDKITFQDKDKWVAVKIDYVKEMTTGHFQDIMFITEFKGRYPEVDIFSDVDIKELTNGEKNPTFLTIPIGMAGVTSGNKRHYNESFLVEMEKQVKDKKPVGIMGHLSEKQRATDFPVEAVHWIGTKRVNEFLWGKGYLPEGEPRNRLQRYKATNKRIATSIDAAADGVWDAKLGAYVMSAETLNLGQIDIAPEDRAGIPSLAAVPLLTREMLDANAPAWEVKVPTEEVEMGKEEVLKDLTVADVSALPQAVKDAMRAEYIKEMKTELGLKDGDDVVATVKGLQTNGQVTELSKITSRITELASKGDKMIKVESVRKLVTEMIFASHPETVEEAEAMYGEVIESQYIKDALQEFVSGTMGPNRENPIPSQASSSEKTGKYFVIPKISEEE